jgi:hypothetical protein
VSGRAEALGGVSNPGADSEDRMEQGDLARGHPAVVVARSAALITP